MYRLIEPLSPEIYAASLFDCIRNIAQSGSRYPPIAILGQRAAFWKAASMQLHRRAGAMRQSAGDEAQHGPRSAAERAFVHDA